MWAQTAPRAWAQDSAGASPEFVLRADGVLSQDDAILLARNGEPIPFNYPLDAFLHAPAEAIRAITESLCDLSAHPALLDEAMARNRDLLDKAADGALNASERSALEANHTLVTYGVRSGETYIRLEAPFCVRVNAPQPIVVQPGDTIDNILDAGQFGAPVTNYRDFARLNAENLQQLAARDTRCARLRSWTALLRCVATVLEPGDALVQSYAPLRSFRFESISSAQTEGFWSHIQNRALRVQFDGPPVPGPVRLMNAVSAQIAGTGCDDASLDPALYPLNAARVWDAIQRQSRLTQTRQRAIMGLIDTGVTGPGGTEFPEALWAINQNPAPAPSDANLYSRDRFGAALGYGANVQPISSDPDHDHGTGVANLLFGGSLLRHQLIAAAGAGQSPIRMRVFNLARRSAADVLQISAPTDGIQYLSYQSNDPAITANIINLSLEENDLYGDFASLIHNRTSVLFVAAAGNGESQTSAIPRNLLVKPIYPAALGGGSPNVITVTALRPDGALAAFANFGATKVDIAAPGCAIQTLDSQLGTHRVSGTSFSAPLVSFTAALTEAFAPYPMRPAEAKARIILAADFHDELSGRVARGAVLNVERAVSVNSDVLTWNGQLYFGAYQTPRDLGSICVQQFGSASIALLRVGARDAHGMYSITRGYLSPTDDSAMLETCQDDLGVQGLIFVTDEGRRIDLHGQSFDLLMHLNPNARATTH